MIRGKIYKKKAHFHTKKDTLLRHGADLHVIQALQIYQKRVKSCNNLILNIYSSILKATIKLS